jgi:hypothetical protein
LNQSKQWLIVIMACLMASLATGARAQTFHFGEGQSSMSDKGHAHAAPVKHKPVHKKDPKAKNDH